MKRDINKKLIIVKFILQDIIRKIKRYYKKKIWKIEKFQFVIIIFHAQARNEDNAINYA
jgi:hypothetical protein